jgi:hypothetical protein
LSTWREDEKCADGTPGEGLPASKKEAPDSNGDTSEGLRRRKLHQSDAGVDLELASLRVK